MGVEIEKVGTKRRLPPALAWFASVVAVAIVTFTRLIAAGLTCGDDGPADYGDADAQRYCARLRELGAFDKGQDEAFWIFVAAIAVAIVAGLVALTSRPLLRRVTEIACGITLIGVLPLLVTGPFATAFYLLPLVSTLTVTLVAFARSGREWASRSAVASLVVSGVLLLPSCSTG